MFIRSLNKFTTIFNKIRLDKSKLFTPYHQNLLLRRSFCIRKVVHSNKLPAVREMDTIIGIGQMCSTNDKEWNRKQVEEIVKSAVEQNACFLFLPECCDYVGTNKEETLALAERLDGDTVNFYKGLAKDNNIWLSIGGFHERIIKDEKLVDRINNTHIVINKEGELAAVYRKLHLFDVETPEFKFHESSTVDGGDYILSPVFDTPIGGGIGLMICYDVRFPEVSTILRRRGAKFLTYPSAFSYSTGKAHWEILLRSRAIENQCFVIAAAQVGFHNDKRQSWGHGMIVDPWGKILIECEPDTSKPICKTVALDLVEIDSIRERLPCFDHRREDIYALAAVQLKLPVSSVPESKLRKRAQTILKMQSEDQQEQIPEDEEPYFMFANHPVYKSTIFYETASSLAFTNITCVVPGHILVVSRRRVERLKDLNPEEIVDFFVTVCKCQRLLEEYYQTTSATVTVQDGENAGQTVKHVHCHIMPRKLGDFEHNDQIYIELNRHDHPDVVGPGASNAVKRRMRSIEERSKEAEEYQKMFQNFKFIKNI